MAKLLEALQDDVI